MLPKFSNVLTTLIRAHQHRFAHNYIYKMDEAYLRQLGSSDQFQISFQYSNTNLKVDRRFNFSRQLSETVGTFVKRVGTNVEKALFKKKRKKKTEEPPQDNSEIKVSITLNNTAVSEESLCQDVFRKENSVILEVLDRKYKVLINAPWIDNIALPNSVLSTFPVYPSKFEHSFTNKTLSEFTWHRSENKNTWTQVGSGFIYTATHADVDSYLRLMCVPRNEECEGPASEVVSDVKVAASPGICPFETRHQFTKEASRNNEFRVVSYNILADLYCDSDYTRTELYPYCPPYALQIDYRKQLVLKELLGYNADIICLQEVDKKVYNYDFEPVFSSLDYGSNFMLKGGLVAEGLACLFNMKKFRFVESNGIVFSEHLEKNAIFADIWAKVSVNEKLSERILQRPNIVQTVALQSVENDSNVVIVANTHLYFHPDADHIRLLQGAMAIRYVQHIADELRKKFTHKKISLVFCGDFNSVPECGIYRLFTTNYVSPDCVDFRSNKEEAVQNVELRQPFKLASGCGTPEFTNFTAGFQDCLDYIFYDTEHLEVTQVVPLPSNEELNANTALPSIVFPSDHISLVCDLKWL